jgi:RimK family alpha-L-glutamate ligase
VVEKIKKIAIITDDPGWHGSELSQSLATHGLGCQYVSLTECLICTGSEQDLILPGFEDALPLGIFVRGIPGGSLEQVIFRLNILHALKDLGICVYNDPRAIERTVDKPLTSLLLKRAGLPTPATWICETPAQANAILEQETRANRRLVLKPLFGSQGLGIYLLESARDLVHDDKFAGVYYLQSYIERPDDAWLDIRVFVIDGKACSAMLRRGQTWITNRAQGATCEVLPLDNKMRELAEAAVRVLDIDYAGVDLMPDINGELHIIEVNSVPAWFGLQKVTDFSIATRLIDSFVSKIAKNEALTTVHP